MGLSGAPPPPPPNGRAQGLVGLGAPGSARSPGQCLSVPLRCAGDKGSCPSGVKTGTQTLGVHKRRRQYKQATVRPFLHQSPSSNVLEKAGMVKRRFWNPTAGAQIPAASNRLSD